MKEAIICNLGHVLMTWSSVSTRNDLVYKKNQPRESCQIPFKLSELCPRGLELGH